MAAWCWTAWGQIWPNLAASALWAPAAVLGHHLVLRHHLRTRSLTRHGNDDRGGDEPGMEG